MSDFVIRGTDPTLVDFKFRLDDRLMELNLDRPKGNADIFELKEPGVRIWSLGEIKGMIEGLFGFERVMSMVSPDGEDVLIDAKLSSAAVADDDCLPPYAGRGADGEYGLAAGIFVFGPVFARDDKAVPDTWEIGRYFWEANTMGILRCLPGFAADF